MSRSDGQSEKITSLLKELKDTCATISKQMEFASSEGLQVKKVHFAGGHLSTGNAVLAVFQHLSKLRGLLHARAVYLNFLAEEGHPILVEKMVDLGHIFSNVDLKPIPAPMSSMPFMEKVGMIEIDCKKDTRDIYEKEGKLSELGRVRVRVRVRVRG